MLFSTSASTALFNKKVKCSKFWNITWIHLQEGKWMTQYLHNKQCQGLKGYLIRWEFSLQNTSCAVELLLGAVTSNKFPSIPAQVSELDLYLKGQTKSPGQFHSCISLCHCTPPFLTGHSHMHSLQQLCRHHHSTWKRKTPTCLNPWIMNTSGLMCYLLHMENTEKLGSNNLELKTWHRQENNIKRNASTALSSSLVCVRTQLLSFNIIPFIHRS